MTKQYSMVNVLPWSCSKLLNEIVVITEKKIDLTYLGFHISPKSDLVNN